jgi:guanylate kinase
LSRSWTTRAQRAGEADKAYVFTTREEFEKRVADGGFLEWTDFLGNLYGTPTPVPPKGRDVVLEIELDGARQVRARHPDALVVFVVAPSRDEQIRRLRGRGDPERKVEERVRKALEEEPIGRALADAVVVNDDLDRAVAEITSLVDERRSAPERPGSKRSDW